MSLQIAQYETELNDKRQDYLSKMTNLQLDEQHEALSQRMEELTDIRQELDSRFQQCMEYEAEVGDTQRPGPNYIELPSTTICLA